VVEVTTSLSKLFERTDQATKVIKVKSIDQFVNDDVTERQIDHTEQLTTEKKSLREQVNDLKKEVATLEAKKQQHIQETEAEINALREAWATEKQTYIDQANEKGYQAGFAEGEKASLQKYTELIEEANQTVQLAQDDYQDIIKSSEPMMIKLAVHMAEKIIHHQLSIDEDSLHRIVVDVLQDLSEQAEVKIFASPKDYEHLLRQKKDFENLLSTSSKLAIYVNEDLEPGMCKIEYPSGKTDASIQTQLTMLESELLKTVMEKDE